MTAEVIDIRSRLPHMEGKCICLNCKKEWQGVAEIGVIDTLECPECGLFKGVFNAVAAPEMCWTCPCGCYHFFGSKDGMMCALCGLTQVF